MIVINGGTGICFAADLVKCVEKEALKTIFDVNVADFCFWNSGRDIHRAFKGPLFLLYFFSKDTINTEKREEYKEQNNSID